MERSLKMIPSIDTALCCCLPLASTGGGNGSELQYAYICEISWPKRSLAGYKSKELERLSAHSCPCLMLSVHPLLLTMSSFPFTNLHSTQLNVLNAFMCHEKPALCRTLGISEGEQIWVLATLRSLAGRRA